MSKQVAARKKKGSPPSAAVAAAVAVLAAARHRRPALSDLAAAQQRQRLAQPQVVSAWARRRHHPPLMDLAEVASPALPQRRWLHLLQLGLMWPPVIPLLQDHGNHSRLIDHGALFLVIITPQYCKLLLCAQSCLMLVLCYVVKTSIQLVSFTLLLNADSFVTKHFLAALCAAKTK